MTGIIFPITGLVRYLSARNLPPSEIDRIVVVLITYNMTGDLAAKIGATHINTVRAFLKLEKEKVVRRKRIRELVASTVASMEGEDVATKKARLESVVFAVHTLGTMTQTTR